MHDYLVLIFIILLAVVVVSTASRLFFKCSCDSNKENFSVNYPHTSCINLNEKGYSTNDENPTGDYSSVAPNRDIDRWYQPEMGNIGDGITTGYVYYKTL